MAFDDGKQQDLHSRQLAVYDRETMRSLFASNLGAEFLINLLMRTENDVGENRALASVQKLQELNNTVFVATSTKQLTKEQLSDFQSTTREVKRLDSITRSPLYAQFGEALNGLSTIRAYKAYDRMANINADSMADTLGGIMIWLTATVAVVQNGRAENQEAFASIIESNPPPPEECSGSIKFEDVVLRYNALFGLTDLRKVLGIIPQAPVLFSGIAGSSYIPIVQAALPRLLGAAAPPEAGACENCRQFLKVLRLWIERNFLPESLLRRFMNEIRVSNDESSAGSFRRPSRAERAIDDPIREMEGMLDEYGSNATFQLTNGVRNSSVPAPSNAQEASNSQEASNAQEGSNAQEVTPPFSAAGSDTYQNGPTRSVRSVMTQLANTSTSKVQVNVGYLTQDGVLGVYNTSTRGYRERDVSQVWLSLQTMVCVI